MSGPPTSFRFENSDMQHELFSATERLGIGVEQLADGTLRFKADDWGAVNTEAHKLRRQRFGAWYFLTIQPASMAPKMIKRLRENSLPYEVEFHDGRLILLLPETDQQRHMEFQLQ